MAVILMGAYNASQTVGACMADVHDRFFTVQSQDDRQRLRTGGEPWPSQPRRAQFGPGVYAWRSIDEAEAYRGQLQSHGATGLGILRFHVAADDLAVLPALEVASLPDEDAWMRRHSAIWTEPDPPEPHAFKYIVRMTQLGAEHYFHWSTHGQLEWGPLDA